MNLPSLVLALCFSVPALSAMAASPDLANPTPIEAETDAAAFHALQGMPLNERRSIMPLSDHRLADIQGQGTIDISILVFGGSVLSLDHLMVNPGPPNVGVFVVVPPSPCRDVC